MPRILPILFVLAAFGLVVPAGALADGEITLSGTQLVYQSDQQAEDNLTISIQNSAFECGQAALPCIQLGDSQDVRDAVVGADCVRVIDIVAACSLAKVKSLRLNLRDADDTVSVLEDVPPTTMDGSFGADSLRSGGGNDVLLGGPGDDTLDDSGDDANGDDLIDGGAEDDQIRVGFGDDDVIGGAGTDSAQLGSADDTVRLDDAANDGRSGEKKNIHSDLEVVDGGGGRDTMFGTAAVNGLRGGPGGDLVDGGSGDDSLEGGTGADDLIGGAGTDRVTYPEPAGQRVTLDNVRDDGAAGETDNVRPDIEDVAGGPGNDEIIGNGARNRLDGGAGDDRIDGGGDEDVLLGDAGADTLFARDGIRDRVDCGAQADGGEGDTIDELANCETVALSTDRIADADGDGATKPGDCDDGNAAIRPGVADVPENGVDEDCSGADGVNLDRDGDKFLRPTDCDDANPRINPGARDIPGNRVDEDCSQGPAPFPLLGSIATGIFDFPGRFTSMVSINIRRPRKGSTLRITCRGGGCPFKTRTRKIKRNSSKTQVINRPLGKARLRRGARVELRLTKPRTIGFFVRFKVGQRVFPAKTELCLPPGKKRPSRCTA